MATIRDKVGHLETLPIDPLNAHLDASFIFNHLDTMNGGPNFSFVTRRAKELVYNSFGLDHLRRYGPVCDESLPYPSSKITSGRRLELRNMEVQRARHNKLFIFSKGFCLPYSLLLTVLYDPYSEATPG
jgi:hypothetical protein